MVLIHAGLTLTACICFLEMQRQLLGFKVGHYAVGGFLHLPVGDVIPQGPVRIDEERGRLMKRPL